MQDYVGKHIDRYRITERLGVGGMAVVYKAYDTRLERDVALKVIRTAEIPPSQYERLMKRFEREAKAQARFKHPHIVPVHEYGEGEGTPYLVMAYISGGTLKAHTGKPIPYEKAIRWLVPIADALAYAHSRGVIHRDIKPSNILFDEDGQPYLADFGIAKILETDEATLTGTGFGVGTPEYMAPEQWQGKASAASDQYALGVVLYELLTGVKPYTADTPAAIILMQVNEPLRSPRKLVSTIPESVEKILYKALALSPQHRYDDMAAFKAALERELPVQPVPAPAPPVKVEPQPDPPSEMETLDRLVPTPVEEPSRMPPFVKEAKPEVVEKAPPLAPQVKPGAAEKPKPAKVTETYSKPKPAMLKETKPPAVKEEPHREVPFKTKTPGKPKPAKVKEPSRKPKPTASKDTPLIAKPAIPAVKEKFPSTLVPKAEAVRAEKPPIPKPLKTPAKPGAKTKQEKPKPKPLTLPSWLGRAVGFTALGVGLITGVFFLASGLLNQGKKPASALMGTSTPTAQQETLPSSAIAANETSLPAEATATKTPLPTPTAVPAQAWLPENLAVISLDNVEQLQEIHKFQIDNGEFREIFFLPEGKQFAVFTTLGIFLYDNKTLEVNRFIEAPNDAWYSEISPDGNLLVLFGGQEVLFLDLQTGEHLDFLKEIQYGRSIAFSQDGHFLAVVGSTGVEIWDLDQKVKVHNLVVSGANSLALSPGAELLAVGGENTTIRIYNLNTGNLLRSMKGSDDETVNKLAFNADGSRLISINRTSVHLWDPHNGELLQKLEADTEGYFFVGISSDGNLIVTINGNGVVNHWDTQNNKLLRTGDLSRTFDRETYDSIMSSDYGYDKSAISFSSDLDVFAIANWNGPIELWDLNSSFLIGTINDFPSIGAKALSPDKKTLAFVYSTSQSVHIDLKNLQTGNLIHTIEVDGHNSKNPFSLRDPWLSFSPDGENLFFADSDGNINIYDSKNGNLLRVLEIKQQITNLIYSPDGKSLAVGYSDGSVNLVDAYSGTLINSLKQKDSGLYRSTTSISFSPDGNLVATGGHDRVIHVWDTHTGALLKTFSGFNESINRVLFSPDGNYLVSLTNLIRFWDLNTASNTITLNRIWFSRKADFIFSPDGYLFFTIYGDNIINIYNSFNGYILGSLDLNNEKRGSFASVYDPDLYANRIFLTPDGKVLVADGMDSMLHLWGIPEP